MNVDAVGTHHSGNNADKLVYGAPMPRWRPGIDRAVHAPCNYRPVPYRTVTSVEHLHTDLMAVLCACAAYVDLQPHTLLK
jgi:hypothetical protein